MNLDLVVLSRLPVSPGLWGLGPELPRRAPLLAVVSWAGAVGASAWAWKLLALLALVVAFVGAARLVRDASLLCRLGAGVLYAASPFVLTRLGIGHLALVAATAVLPWALPVLLRPGDDVGRTFRWSAALGITGVFGGVLALVAVGVGLVADRFRSAVVVTVVVVASQLPWMVPGAVVLSQGQVLASGRSFPTDAAGVAGVFQVLAGHGFWQELFQVGGRGGWLVALCGAAIIALAVAGHGRLPPQWRGRALAAAVVGLTIALSSAVPGLRGIHDAISGTALGAAIRESQRVLPLYLVWALPAAALGADRIARSAGAALAGAVTAAPAALGLLLAGPGLWAVGGELRTVELPPEWDRARAAVAADPGTVLAAPFHQYLNVPVARGRRVLHPAPYHLPGDVLASSDPELEPGLREASDGRERTAASLVERFSGSGPVAEELADAGIRWVFVLHTLDWRTYRALGTDPGLDVVVDGGLLTLYRVEPWQGAVVADDGRVVRFDPIATPVARVAPSGAATWNAPAQAGWLRGWTPASSTADGRIRLPAGAGVVWYWPSVLTVGAYLVVAAAFCRSVRIAGRRARLEPG